MKVPYEEPWTCWHSRDRTMGMGIGEKIVRELAAVRERVSQLPITDIDHLL